jgi:hypothetical protein
MPVLLRRITGAGPQSGHILRQDADTWVAGLAEALSGRAVVPEGVWAVQERQQRLGPVDGPPLDEIARWEGASPAHWAEVCQRWGLPCPPSPEWVLHEADDWRLMRIPLGALQDLAGKARELLWASDVTVGAHPPPPVHIPDVRAAVRFAATWAPVLFPTDPDRQGGYVAITAHSSAARAEAAGGTTRGEREQAVQNLLVAALRGSLQQAEPVVIRPPRGVPGHWQLRLEGWWPLAIIRWCMPRVHHPPALCAAEDCWAPVLPPRRKYCSERCRWRDKKQAQRRKRSQEVRTL